MNFQRKKAFLNDLLIWMNLSMIKQNLAKIACAFLFLSLQCSYGIDHHPYNFEETPLGFYNSSPNCQCGSLDIQANNLPISHSIRVSPVKNQGPLPTCVSFTAVSCGECCYPDKRFSETEFTILAQTNREFGHGCQGGLFLGKALKVVQQYGLMEDNSLPSYDYFLSQVAKKNNINTINYNWKDQLRETKGAYVCNVDNYNETMREYGINLQLTGNLAKDSTPYKFTQLYAIHHISKNSIVEAVNRVNRYGYNQRQAGVTELLSNMNISSIGSPLQADIQSVKKALCCNFPVAAAVNVYGNWDNPTHGIIGMPHILQGNDSHAIVLTGFNDTTQMFKFKNSWGQSWGNGGFGYLPYNYVKLYATELVAVAR